MIVFNRSSALAPFFFAGCDAFCEDCTGKTRVWVSARRGVDGRWEVMRMEDGERWGWREVFVLFHTR
jgi:hypothetical protein